MDATTETKDSSTITARIGGLLLGVTNALSHSKIQAFNAPRTLPFAITIIAGLESFANCLVLSDRCLPTGDAAPGGWVSVRMSHSATSVTSVLLFLGAVGAMRVVVVAMRVVVVAMRVVVVAMRVGVVAMRVGVVAMRVVVVAMRVGVVAIGVVAMRVHQHLPLQHLLLHLLRQHLQPPSKRLLLMLLLLRRLLLQLMLLQLLRQGQVQPTAPWTLSTPCASTRDPLPAVLRRQSSGA